ncbi:MAG: TIGR02266 family protein [Deltaproteobacteria bacterium]|nr:TIGR02266 family protein [Deltaproteobacteria bacterium]
MENLDSERRQHPRMPVRLKVRVSQQNVEQFIESYTANISVGGIFIRSKKNQPIGTILFFEILLKDGRTVFKGKGEVTWSQSDTSPGGQPQLSGMGVKFLALDQASKKIVAKIVAAAKQQADTTNDHEAAAAEFDLDSPESPTAQKPTEEYGINRRKNPRTTLGLIVQLKFEDLEEFIEGYSINISSGGIFIRNQNPKPPGTIIEFELQLTSGEPVLSGKGEVTWSRPPAKPGQQPRVPGMGISFISLDDSSKDIVERIIAKSQAESEAEQQAQEQAEDQAQEPVHEPEPATEAQAARVEPVIAQPKTKELSAGETKKLVINTLITCLEIADQLEIVNAETTRYLLESWYTKYYQDGTVDLTMFWNMLIAEEEIDVDEASLPIYIFQASKPGHGFNGRFPLALDSHAGAKRAKDIARRRIHKRGGFAKVLEQVSSGKKIATKPTRKPKPATTKPKQTSKPKKRKAPAGQASPKSKVIGLVLIVIAVAGMAVSIFFCLPKKASFYDVSICNDILELDQGTRQGSTLNAVIIDADWDDLDSEERRGVTAKVAKIFADDGIVAITLYNESYIPAATILAAEPGANPQIKVGDEIFTAPPKD